MKTVILFPNKQRPKRKGAFIFGRVRLEPGRNQIRDDQYDFLVKHRLYQTAIEDGWLVDLFAKADEKPDFDCQIGSTLNVDETLELVDRRLAETPGNYQLSLITGFLAFEQANKNRKTVVEELKEIQAELIGAE